jgi:hypothetical protein
MTKMSVFVETLSGEVLAEVISFKDKITIGSSENCSVCLKNRKLADVESEVFVLNNECWLQVGKEGSPISLMGKQYRSIKITQSSQFHFRDLILKVILDSIPEFEGEATKIVNEALLDNSEKTRLVMATDAPHVPEQPDIEATRIVSKRQESSPEFSLETTRIVTPEENLPKVKKTETIATDWEAEIAQRPDFGRASDFFEQFLVQFHIKERIFPILGLSFVGLAAAVFILSNSGTSSIAQTPTKVVKNEIPSTNVAPTETVVAEQEPAVGLESATSQTKDEYIRELSSLFN